ncbi:MAG: class I SAM-dependent methyltransferase [Liquorilactobacillus ghanensis]|uniref:class I SAM-dependent methyltransferase n=1 Tax=Liquorilactobacillus ghanensis TaxID=399370 RepID=UPI0039EB2A94
MNIGKIEQGLKLFLKSIDILQQALDSSFIDAVIESGDNLNDGKILVENGQPSQSKQIELTAIYDEISQLNLKREQKRQLLQFALLKAEQVDKIQTNHQLTPDVSGILISSLLQNFLNKSQPSLILDLAVGTGNLLFTVANNLEKAGFKKLELSGIDNDDTLLAVASMSAHWQKTAVELFHQDAVEPLVTRKADVVISDLPVGYYPLDKRAANFVVHAAKGHSFTHFLLVEQAMLQLKPGGLGVFLIPKDVFKTTQSNQLLSMIQENGYFQGLLNLPSDLFTDEKAQKAILLLQKKGKQAHQAEPVLIGEFPSVKEHQEVADFIQQIKQWQKENLDY